MILMRHAQSHFNLHFAKTRRDPGIEDPELTDEGWRQAETAAAKLKGQPVSRLLCSPYTRTLQTASVIAETLDLAIEIEPLVRERAFFVCDIGSPRSLLESRFGHLDFTSLEEIWWSPGPESEADLGQRCREFTGKARDLSDWQQTLVISHWAFIQGLTGDSLTNGQQRRYDPRD